MFEINATVNISWVALPVRVPYCKTPGNRLTVEIYLIRARLPRRVSASDEFFCLACWRVLLFICICWDSFQSNT